LLQIRGKIAKNSKVWGQLRAKLKKLAANVHFEKKALNSRVPID
jgi:hypothetical protein